MRYPGTRVPGPIPRHAYPVPKARHVLAWDASPRLALASRANACRPLGTSEQSFYFAEEVCGWVRTLRVKALFLRTRSARLHYAIIEI